MTVWLLLAGLGLLAQPGQYSLDELVFLNGIGGFGDRGTLDVGRDVVSPHNKLGFSLKVNWEDHPGDPPWWSIRVGLPAPAEGYDTFSCELYVESVEGGAGLNLFLYETDDDRWVCWQAALDSVEQGKWHHIEVPREGMRMWFLGNHEAQWDRLAGLALEPGGGKAVFYVDAPRLSGPAGSLDLFGTADDGLRARPEWQEPLHSPIEPGYVYFPFDAARLDAEALRETPVKLARLLGPVGVPISGYPRNIVDLTRYYAEQGVPAVYYSSFGSGYQRFFTRRQAWDVNAAGGTLNAIPGAQTGWDFQHAFAIAHPAVREAMRHKVDALVKAGFGTWMVVDYTFPWWDTLWGYSGAMVDAYRRDLAGADQGLHLRDGEAETVAHFPDYFRAYNGFYPRPGDLGLKSWEEYEPPRPAEEGDLANRRRVVFMYLRSYEWLKLPDEIGRYYRDRGGQGLWIIPNPEDTHGSSDYVWMVRSAGVGNILPEWFGPIGWAAEAFYSSGAYLREQARRGGTRLSIIQETGAGGHSAPYLDWRIAYAGVYSLTASGQLDDFDNDFLDEATYEGMSDPARNEYQFRRFRDGVAKAMAFLQARKEKARRPGRATVLCVATRPPAHASSSLFFGVGQEWSLACGASRAGLVLDTRDSFELERVLPGYDVVFYSPRAPRVGDPELLRRWLEDRPGRLLVTHSFIPTRRADGYWHLDRGAGVGDEQAGAVLGLGPISYTEHKRCTVTEAEEDWREFLPPGEEIELPHPLTRCPGGQVLVATDRGPLVSRFGCARGEVVYLHYTGGVGIRATQLDTAVARAIGRARRLPTLCDAPYGLMVQVFEVAGGQAVVVWDGGAMARWNWRYQAGIEPMAYEAPDVRQTFRLPAAGPGPYHVYDFLADTSRQASPREGWVELGLDGALCGVFYVIEDSAAGRATAAAARDLRRRMRELHFDEVAMAPD